MHQRLRRPAGRAIDTRRLRRSDWRSPATGAGLPAGLRRLIDLQRTAGNRAVVELIGRTGQGVGVQRDVDTFLKGTAAGKATSGSIATTPGKRDVQAFFFPGTSEERALVIGGVHGSEVSGVDVANRLVARLSGPKARRPYYTVIVVPTLFPDAVARRRTWEATVKGPLSPADYAAAAARASDPGRVTPGEIDPNRQFPAIGSDFDPSRPTDALGRTIQAENQALLKLIQQFRPSRIASLHAIKEVDRAGVFADPYPAASGPGPAPDPKLAAAADRLALEMARRVEKGGGHARGNKLGTAGETSLYPGQNPKLSAAQIARENRRGVSLGQWAPSRGMSVITIELPEQYDTASPVSDPGRVAEIESRVDALDEIFLGPPLATTVPIGALLKAAWQAVSRLGDLAAATARALVRRIVAALASLFP